jgi:hypothetical protein
MFKILSVIPTNNTSAASRETIIQITFSDKALGLNASTLFLTKANNPNKILASLVKVSNTIWNIIPNFPLAMDQSYTVYATSDIIDSNNAPLESFTSSFKVQYNTANPLVFDTYPKSNAVSVRTNGSVEIIFSEPLNNVNINTFQLKKIASECIINPPPPPITYQVSGTIIDSTTSQVLSGATVNLRSSSLGPILGSSISDSLGHYSITFIDPGTYTFECVKTGYNAFTSMATITTLDIIKNVSLILTPVIPPVSSQDIFLIKEDQSISQNNETPDISFYTVNNFTYTPGDKSLLVFISGVLQKNGVNYLESSSTIVQTINGPYLDLPATISFVKLDLSKAKREEQVFSVNTSALTFTTFSDLSSAGSILIFKNGLLQRESIDYTITSANTVTFIIPFSSGDWVTAIQPNAITYHEIFTLANSSERLINLNSSIFDLSSMDKNIIVFGKGKYSIDQYDYFPDSPTQLILNSTFGFNDRVDMYRSHFNHPNIIIPVSFTPTFFIPQSYPSSCETDIPATVEQYSPTVWILTPTTALEPQTTYLVRLTSGIVDDQGNALSLYEFTFETEYNITIPEIIKRYPFPSSIGVSVNSPITLNFSEPISEASPNSIELSSSTGPVDKVVAFIDSTTLQITPINDLQYNTTYTLKVKSGILDDAGNSALPETYIFDTEYNTEEPTITRLLPEDLQAHWPLMEGVTVEFNKPVYRVSKDSLFLKDSSEHLIDSDVFQLAPNLYEIKPKINLASRDTYTIEALPVIKDDRGHPLVNSFISFTAEYGTYPPAVLNVSPFPGRTDVALNETIRITFNKPTFNISADTFTIENLGTGEEITGSYTHSNNVSTFTPTFALLRETEYKVTLKKLIEGENHRQLAKPFSYTFTTESFLDIDLVDVNFYAINVNQKNKLEDKTSDISPDAKFIIDFNKPVLNALGNIELNPGGYIVTEQNPLSYLLQPNSLEVNTDYTLTIDHSIRDDRGKNLINDRVYRFTTRIVPPKTTNGAIVNVGNTKSILFNPGNTNNLALNFELGEWSNIPLTQNIPNTKNCFPIYLFESDEVFFIGGLTENNTKTGTWKINLNTGNQQEISPVQETPDILDWVGLVRVFDTTDSLFKQRVVSLSFYSSGTEVKTFDTLTNAWSNVLNLGSNEIAQAIGSFVWTEYLAQDSVTYILGGMASKNNNLPLKLLQKVRFTLDSGVLKYQVDSAIGKEHIIFNSPLAFQYGLRTDRTGNEPNKRGSSNNPYISSLRCEQLYPLASGLFESQSQSYIEELNLKTHILLPFFINPPDGVVRPFMEVYETDLGSFRYNLPKVHMDYPYPNHTQFLLSSNILNSSGRSSSLLLFGGKDEDSKLLNSTWIISPNLSTDSSFQFTFSKNNPFFTT